MVGETELGKQGSVFYALWNDETQDYPSDKEIKAIHETAWQFLIDENEKKATLAHLLFKLTKEIEEYRKSIPTSHDKLQSENERLRSALEDSASQPCTAENLEDWEVSCRCICCRGCCCSCRARVLLAALSEEGE